MSTDGKKGGKNESDTHARERNIRHPQPTTWWSAPCAAVTRGHCWAFRRHGTNLMPIAAAPCAALSTAPTRPHARIRQRRSPRRCRTPSRAPQQNAPGAPGIVLPHPRREPQAAFARDPRTQPRHRPVIKSSPRPIRAERYVALQRTPRLLLVQPINKTNFCCSDWLFV